MRVPTPPPPCQKGQSFFANPQTGECAWAVPSGTFVLPPRPEGQWWELYDEERRLPYYYHTQRRETRWEKPTGFVIPLASIQESTMGKRFSRSELNGQSLADVGDDGSGASKTEAEGNARPLSSATSAKRQPPPPQQEPQHNDIHGPSPAARSTMKKPSEASEKRRSRGPPPQSASTAHGTRSGAGLSTIPSSTDLPATFGVEKKASHRLRAPPRSADGRSSRSLSENGGAGRQPSPDLRSLSSAETRRPYRRERDPAKRKLLSALHEASTTGSTRGGPQEVSLPTSARPWQVRQRSAPIFVERRRSVSLGALRRAGGPEQASSFEVFAAKHFAIHRVGLLRRKYPLRRLVQWQREPLRSSLLPLDHGELRKDAVRFFMVILRYCGDRTNPVFWPKVPPSPCVSASPSLERKGAEPIKETGTPAKTINAARLRDASAGPAVLEEVKWMLERALVAPALRDEVLAQTMKQMTANESQGSWLRAWSLLCILLSFFPPSKELSPTLHSFIRQSREGAHGDTRIDVDSLADFCTSKLAQSAQHASHRVRWATVADIEAAEAAPFDPRVYGQTLEVIMSRQADVYPDAAVPIV